MPSTRILDQVKFGSAKRSQFDGEDDNFSVFRFQKHKIQAFEKGYSATENKRPCYSYGGTTGSKFVNFRKFLMFKKFLEFEIKRSALESSDWMHHIDSLYSLWNTFLQNKTSRNRIFFERKSLIKRFELSVGFDWKLRQLSSLPNSMDKSPQEITHNSPSFHLSSRASSWSSCKSSCLQRAIEEIGEPWKVAVVVAMAIEKCFPSVYFIVFKLWINFYYFSNSLTLIQSIAFLMQFPL